MQLNRRTDTESLSDPGGGPPNGTQFFRFRMCFHRNQKMPGVGGWRTHRMGEPWIHHWEF